MPADIPDPASTTSLFNTGDALRERLVSNARTLVRNEGMASLNLRLIAEQSGTSTQAIYTLFGGKTGLIRAMYEHWIKELELELHAAQSQLSPIQLMIQTARIYRKQALSDPQLFLFGLSPSANEANIVGMMISSRTFALFCGFIQAAIQQGEFETVELVEQQAKGLWAAIHGAVLFEICHPDSNNLVEYVLPVLLKGLKK